MRSVYKKVSEKIGKIAFDRLWEGFHPYPFALYTDREVYFKDKVIPWNYFISGYDPMNMFKIGNKIYCRHFIKITDRKTKESQFIRGSVLLEVDGEDTTRIIGYWK